MALILALAALLVFAPVARADIEGGAHPYRDVVNPSSDDSEVAPSDDDGDDDGDDDDGDDEDDDRSGDDGDDDDEDEDDDEGEGSEDDDESSDDDDGSSNNPPVQTGPTTSAVPGALGSWVGLLLVALAAIAVGTVYVLRQRRNQNR